MHENQLRVTVDMVRELVSGQFPEWELLSIAPVQSEGTVNAIFRIGDGLAARFPLQAGDVDATRQWLLSEADAALELLEHTSFAVPKSVAVGEPGAGYPLPWSIQTWVPGTTASQEDPSTSADFAHDLARFIDQVRAIDVRGRHFAGNGRGGDLRSHDEWMDVCFEQSEHLSDVSRLRRIWARLRELPRQSPDVMTHGDPPRGTCWWLEVDSLGSSTLAGSVQRTPPSTSLVPGTCSTPVRGSYFERTSVVTNSNGSAGRHGRSNRRWVPFGTTGSAIHR